MAVPMFDEAESQVIATTTGSGGEGKVLQKERPVNSIEQLWEWRQTIADLYCNIRTSEDPAIAWQTWCDTRSQLFRGHPQSPIEAQDRQGYQGPAMFPYDPSLRLTVRLEETREERITVATGADGELTMRAFARTGGLQDVLGGELTLYWIEGYGGGVFLPFTDATSGNETYGGGRYLLDTIKGADLGTLRPDGSAILDFNFAYFPSCSYSSRYVCPLAPSGNRLRGAVRGGERWG